MSGLMAADSHKAEEIIGSPWRLWRCIFDAFFLITVVTPVSYF